MIIESVVAGKFYPGNPDILRRDILQMLDDASDKKDLPIPKAIIAPHAGYIYSGPIAASAYACLSKAKGKIKRVIIFAPAHRYPVDGVATTSADSYLTPLGEIPIDRETIDNTHDPNFNIIDAAFSSEHAVEVHLPFLQLTIDKFSLTPLIVGYADTDNTAIIMEKLWGDNETLVVISSDLSHYHPYEVAKTWDKKTAEAIIELNPDGFTHDHACGATAIKALLKVAAKKNIQASQIDLRNSGDTAGPRDGVVGYGAFHFV